MVRWLRIVAHSVLVLQDVGDRSRQLLIDSSPQGALKLTIILGTLRAILRVDGNFRSLTNNLANLAS